MFVMNWDIVIEPLQVLKFQDARKPEVADAN